MGRTCPVCSSSEIEEDPSRADVVCMNCGTILEEGAIVSEVQFQERAGGHDVIGQFISHDRAQQNGLVGVPGLNRTESREVTYQRGRKLIQEVASQLRINQHCIDTAFNFFKMCVSRNFTRGRPRPYVVASCLYMTCRLENTSHLLLDFSDVTQVNVYELGRTLNHLTRLLKIHLPTTDPCLYVLRFAIMLEFNDKQKEVVTLATRIVQRMKRDWMATGRRPTGICGAALLLASRAYGFNRTISDIVRVVHISDTVVRKRLDEFACTPSGNLTVDEFSNVDLEHSEDPPAFQEARRRAREERRRVEEQQADDATKEVPFVQKEIDEALKQKMKKTLAETAIDTPVVEEVTELDSETSNLLRSDIIDTVYDAAFDDDYDDEYEAPTHIPYGPTLESLGIRKGNHSIGEINQTVNEEIMVDDNDFGDIDDGEIDSYILSENEAHLKQRIWIKRNGHHVEEMDRKRKERLEEEERKKNDPTRKRRPINIKKREPISAKDHHDAMLQVIKEKKLSTKINYDVLAEIEDGKLEILDDTPRHPHATVPKPKDPPPESETLLSIEATSTSSTPIVDVTNDLQPPPSIPKTPSRKKKPSTMAVHLAKSSAARVEKAIKDLAQKDAAKANNASSPNKSPPAKKIRAEKDSNIPELPLPINIIIEESETETTEITMQSPRKSPRRKETVSTKESSNVLESSSSQSTNEVSKENPSLPQTNKKENPRRLSRAPSLAAAAKVVKK